MAALQRALLPLAAVLTPNVPEAEALLGRTIPDHAAALDAARRLLDLGVPAVLLKGGHLPGARSCATSWRRGTGWRRSSAPRIATRHTHGTGCTLASAVACGLAQGLPLRAAVVRAGAYVHAAILAAPGLRRRAWAAGTRRAV